MDALLYILGLLIVLLGIAISIGIHEIGHLVPAKLFGVKVRQYMIGFGPTVWSKTKGETEYGFKAIPLGGYILMTGMYPPEKKPYKGPFATWIAEARAEVRKDVLEGEESRQFYLLSAPKKLIIMLGGPLMNLILGVVLIVTALGAIGPMQPTLSVAQVYNCIEGEVCEGQAISPAKLAGVEPGDLIQGVDGTAISKWEDAVVLLNQRQGESTLQVLRDGKPVDLKITPVFNERQVYDDSGAALKDAQGLPVTEIRPIIGIQLGAQNTPLGLADSFQYSGQVVAGTFGFLLDLPNQLYQVILSTVGVQERNPTGAVSIVGVGQMAGELTSSDGLDLASKLGSLLLLIGSLNIALFAFNLIPLLPLDGGHVAGAIYEGLKRRTAKAFTKQDPGPIDSAKALPVAYAVWFLLIAMGLILILADLTNPIAF
jgi:membrane-associated protease RseP (regulator of RpoE activity)